MSTVHTPAAGGYSRITVHDDVLSAAVEAVNDLANDLGYDDPRLQALRDLVDPLPEPDVNGVTPSVTPLNPSL